MAWTSPRTWTTGEIVTAAIMNAHLRDNLLWLAGTSGNISVPAVAASGLTGATAASRYVGGTVSGAPASGTFAVGDFIIDQTGKVYVCTVAGTPGTWATVTIAISSVFGRTGAVVAGNADYLAVASGGLTGATAATRFVGGTVSGAPASGTFAVGDFIIDQTGKVYVCTVAGTPGTWTQVGSGGMTNPMTAQYDTIVGGASGTPTRQAAGAAGAAMVGPNSAFGAVGAAYGGGMTLISSVTLVADSPNITFSTIPQTYKHLRVVWQARVSDANTGNEALWCQLNSDTAANYFGQRLYTWTGATVVGANENAQAKAIVGYATRHANPASHAGGGEITFYNYAATSLYKNFGCYSGEYYSTSANSGTLALAQYLWKSVAGITTIKLYPSVSAYLKDGAMASLYGIG